jgi:hypothetical protein
LAGQWFDNQFVLFVLPSKSPKRLDSGQPTCPIIQVTGSASTIVNRIWPRTMSDQVDCTAITLTALWLLVVQLPM